MPGVGCILLLKKNCCLPYGAEESLEGDKIVSVSVPSVPNAAGGAAVVVVGFRMKVVRPTSKGVDAVTQFTAI